MDWDNTRVKNDFIINGYSIKGEIVSDKNEALSGVEFNLFDNSQSGANVDLHAMEVAISNDKGIFEFKDVKCGSYKIIPLYKQDKTTFKISPFKYEILIENKDFIIPNPFSVVGFTAHGRVLTQGSNPLPIQKAKIFVDDEYRTETDNEGYFLSFFLQFFLIKIYFSRKFYVYLKAGEYTLTAKKENYEFTILKNHKVSSNQPTLPFIYSTKYAVCGKVSVEDAWQKESRKIEVFSFPERSLISSTNTNQKGEYCFYLERGNYTVEVFVSKKEKEEGIE